MSKQTQTKGLKRNTIDKYYTKPSIVSECMKKVNELLHIQPMDIFIEPSAGNGSFISSIKSLGCKYAFYDIEPEHPEITKRDFLSNEPFPNPSEGGRCHIIGNPPFGRQSSIAIRFIKKATTFCDTISFILPKSFKKDSLKKTFPLTFHTICEMDLPTKSFLVNQEEHDVPCVFQIWEKRNYERETVEKQLPKNFVFVKKDESPHISVRRVGVYAGQIDTNTSDKSIQSHYFIKFTNKKSIKENVKRLSNITYASASNTVGPKSISKQELIEKFNEFI